MESEKYLQVIDMLMNVIVDDQKELKKLKQKIEHIEALIMKYENKNLVKK